MEATKENESIQEPKTETSALKKKERRVVPPPGKPGEFQQGLDLLVKKYDKALKELAK